jgi:hypothetical protein
VFLLLIRHGAMEGTGGEWRSPGKGGKFLEGPDEDDSANGRIFAPGIEKKRGQLGANEGGYFVAG